MTGTHNYERLPPIHESQDIAEYSSMVDIEFDSQERILLEPRVPPLGDGSIELQESPNRHSVHSFDIRHSVVPTSTSINILRNGWNRMRRKPASKTWTESIRRHPAAEIQPTRIGRGVWKDQLLVDRSLRVMACTMTAFAIGMLIVVSLQIKPFSQRANRFTSSVGGETQNCKTVTRTNTALLFLINVGATMVLGMSNTYQQLVTSLKIDDLKHMLQKFGDSRVGTNSPFNINQKSSGRKSAWAAWLLLISTSMPVHFLANSVIGPSYIVQPPRDVEFSAQNKTEFRYQYLQGGEDLVSGGSFLCWSAFRTGTAHFSSAVEMWMMDKKRLYVDEYREFSMVYSKLVVRYEAENCTNVANSTRDLNLVENERRPIELSYEYLASGPGGCKMGETVRCYLENAEPSQCRLNVRMNAAFVLLGCLLIKAIYMVLVNFLARNKLKRHCLTYGDVIVASATHPELRVQGECMVNANDNIRRRVSHTCHKHCKEKEETKTGDELGHCQSCEKWNSIDKCTGDLQPTMATKIKKSLISNLGNTALTQLCLLMCCSCALLGASIAMGVIIGGQYKVERKACWQSKEYLKNPYCNVSAIDHFTKKSGGFGGFNKSMTLTALAPDDLGNEMMSFSISNGAQFIYSLLYLMMIYNITLVSQEFDWGKLEHERKRLRCTIVKGDGFSQDYLLQLPKMILFPLMAYSVLTHWMLGEALQAQELVWMDAQGGRHVEHSQYIITYAAYPLWFATFLIMLMTSACWWAYTYKREGFIPQMFGSIRTLCAATTALDDFPSNGIKWGDLKPGEQFRHAGLSADDVDKIRPNELYAGLGPDEWESDSESLT